MECGTLTNNDIVIPDPIRYYPFINVDSVPEFKDKFVYPLEYFSDTNGFMFIFKRSKGHICIRTATFAGEILDPEKDHPYTQGIKNITENHFSKLINTIRLVGIDQCILYFSEPENPILVDFRVSLDKMCGPGYLNDFFGKQKIPMQKSIGDPVILDDDNLSKLRIKAKESKAKRVIVKPSSFKIIVRGDEIVPLYGVLNSEVKAAK